MIFDIKEIGPWGTFVGAIIAALCSLVNLVWTYRAKADKIKVNFGYLRPQTGPGEGLCH